MELSTYEIYGRYKQSIVHEKTNCNVGKFILFNDGIEHFKEISKVNLSKWIEQLNWSQQ